MGKVQFLAAQVLAAPLYNWALVDPILGVLDIGLVSTDPPGVGAGLGVNAIQTSVAPRPIYQPPLGEIVKAWEPTLGAGEFVYLAVPPATAIPLGTMVSWFFNAASGQYQAVIVPVKGTSQKTGAPVAVCVASTSYQSGLGITANATATQYAWFQVGGVAQVLKTAIQVAPVGAEAGAGVYISGTAGRIYTTSSSGGQILGARLANIGTITAIASCVLVYLNGRPALEGA